MLVYYSNMTNVLLVLVINSCQQFLPRVRDVEFADITRITPLFTNIYIHIYV